MARNVRSNWTNHAICPMWCTFIWLEDMDVTEDDYTITDTVTVSPMFVYSRNVHFDTTHIDNLVSLKQIKITSCVELTYTKHYDITDWMSLAWVKGNLLSKHIENCGHRGYIPIFHLSPWQIAIHLYIDIVLQIKYN